MQELVEQCERRVAYLETQILKYQAEIDALNMEVKRLTVEKYNVGSSN